MFGASNLGRNRVQHVHAGEPHRIHPVHRPWRDLDRARADHERVEHLPTIPAAAALPNGAALMGASEYPEKGNSTKLTGLRFAVTVMGEGDASQIHGDIWENRQT
jgi:hypothetical protein